MTTTSDEERSAYITSVPEAEDDDGDDDDTDNDVKGESGKYDENKNNDDVHNDCGDPNKDGDANSVTYDDANSTFEYTCTLCDEEDLSTEAEYYCRKCCKQYCSACLEVHKKAHRHHSVLGRDDVEDWGEVKKEVTVEVCPEHDGKEIETYCVDDDQLCCSVCTALWHRSCKQVQHLPDAARGIARNPDLKTLLIQSTVVKTKLDELISKKTNNLSKLRDHCTKLLRDIENLRDQFNATLDHMETRTIEELDKILGAMDDVLEHDIISCRTMIDDMKTLLYDMEERKNADESLAFIAYKKCQKKLSEARCLLKSIPETEFKICFKEYKDMAKYVEDLSMFGEFEATPWIPELPPVRVGVNHVYQTVDKGRSYNVRLNNDRNTCAIVGCCKFSNGMLVLADCDNKKLKVLNERYEIVSMYETKGSPYHMCQVGGRRMAVSVDEDYSDRLYMLELMGKRLVLIRKLGLNHSACGVAYFCGKLLVGSDTAIYVYTPTGKLIQKFYEDKAGSSTVWRFAVGEEARKIYVPNITTNQIYALDVYGNKLATFKDSSLKSPESVSVAVNGNIFVCGGTSNTVLQLDKDCKKKLAKVVDAKDGVSAPRSLWFNNKTAELIIGQWNDSLLVFQMY